MMEPGSLIRSMSGRGAARNYHSFVINEIGQAIVAGRSPVGSTLASDAVMMETYGVSRTVLREALKTLEAMGLVEARPKVGTRVSPHSRWNYFDPQVLAWHFHAPLSVPFIEGLFEVRMPLEIRSAERAAGRRTSEHVRLLKYWVHQMDVAGTTAEPFALARLELHRIVADCAGNPLLRSVLGVVELTLALAVAPDRGGLRAEYAASSVQLCATLVAALEAGQVAETASAMAGIGVLDRNEVLSRVPAGR